MHDHHGHGHKHGQAGQEHAGAGHAGHEGHAEVYRRRFWINLILAVPVVVYSESVQDWLGYTPPDFPGSGLMPPVLGTAIFLYGGWVFLAGAVSEIRERQPGMMLLVSLAITVAFVASAASTLGAFELEFWWELSALVVVMLLFALAQANGTLSELARQSVRLARGYVGLVPIVFFGLTVAIATLGAGNIAGAALIAPVAMAAAGRMGISAFLMVIMVGNGANAGAFSPIAPTGIVASELMAEAGLSGVEWRTYWNTFMAQGFVAFAGYFALGGLALLRSGRKLTAEGLLP